MQWWENCHEWVKGKLQARDRAMADQYARANKLSELGVTFEWVPGQTVLLANPRARSGKSLPRAVGPYTIIGYTGSSGTVVTIESLAGKRKQVSVANLLPLRPGLRPL